MKFFLLFVTYIFSTCATAGILIALRFVACWTPEARCETTAGQGFAILGMTVIAGLMGTFTGCLLAEQVTNVMTNTTQIDRMKGLDHSDPLSLEVDERMVVWHHLGEVFGGDPARDGWQWTWLIPTPVVFRNPEHVAGFGFRDVPKPRSAAEMEMV
jgi:hypothetical protein